MNEPTKTQPDPNVSTEHQKEGDARKPSDTLNKDRETRRTGERDAAGNPVSIDRERPQEDRR